MANPFPFTAGQVLTAAQMNGIGEATIAYTPTISNGTLGNGTMSAYYSRVNKLVFGNLLWTLGSTSTITGTLNISFPVTASANSAFQIVGAGYYYDLSTGLTYIGSTYRTSTTNMILLVHQSNVGTYSNTVIVNNTVPVAFGTGDQIQLSFVYEAA